MARRILNTIVVLLLCNIVFLWELPAPAPFLRPVAAVVLAALYLWVNIKPVGAKGLPGKLKTLGRGCELMLLAAVCAGAQLLLYLALWLALPPQTLSPPAWVINSVVAALLLAVLLANGTLRVLVSSAQQTVRRRVMLFFLWWLPVANIVLFASLYRAARREYRFLRQRCSRNQARRGQGVCQTRYPLLLVHGIFFRDWKRLNYWGRIPAELEANGATIYYGMQQSSSSVEASAEELKAHILRITEETGCEKVNIIAHSKGGLDARYAISRLGMDRYTASLTTVNTPHRGCRFAKKALDNVPQNVAALIAKNYNRAFTALGDDQPDFMSGVSELTDVKCAELNADLPDREGVLYQSVGSYMKSAGSAIFPLNLGYGIVKAVDGEDNDGLVAVSSMPWGAFTLLAPAGRHGISHADVIDLTRKDVEGFDVCEFYVGLAQGLKEKGL